MTASPWNHFTIEELSCPCCEQMKMDPEFMNLMVSLRETADFAFPVTSGYRCPDYNEKVSETGRDGPHTIGKAMDINVTGKQTHEVLRLALANGMQGIGVQQKGKYKSRFLHLDICEGPTRPWVWSY